MREFYSACALALQAIINALDTYLPGTSRVARRAASTFIASKSKTSQFAEGGKRFKIEPTRLIYALRWLHKAHPPDLDLTLARDPEP
jgi:hypothetical protein